MSDGFVYFIQEEETGRIKIGFSENPFQRLKELQTGNSSKMTLIGQIEGGADEENNIHREFAEERIRENGEWFRPSERLTNYIKQRIEKSVDTRLNRNDSYSDKSGEFETDEGEEFETDEGVYSGQSVNGIPNGYMGLDIGMKSCIKFDEIIKIKDILSNLVKERSFANKKDLEFYKQLDGFHK